MKTLILCTIVLTFVTNVVFAQISSLTTTGSSGDFVGWQLGQNISLDIVNEDQFPINFYTNGGAGSGGMWSNLRMFIQGTDGNVGIGNFTTANTLLHLHQSSDDIPIVNFQMTNSIIGNTATDGFLVDVDAAGTIALRQQERSSMQFWAMDDNLGNVPVMRAEFTNGQLMQDNQLTPTDGFRIWNPGYNSSSTYDPDHALDLWCGESNTTHIRFDHSGLIQTINLRFEQIARLNGFWFDAKPYDYQAAASTPFRGEYYFNMDSIEIARFSNVNNANRGFIRMGLQPAGLLGAVTAAVDAARRLEVYDNAAVPQFRITQTDGTNYTDFQTTSNGDLFIDPWAGATSRNVGIGISTPTAKLEVNSPTVSGGSQTTVKVDNINTGAVNPTGLDVQIQGTSGSGLTQAIGININLNTPLNTSSSAAYITNACSGGTTGQGIWSNLTGANANNYGLRSYVTNATISNFGSYLIGNGGTSAFGADCYASNGTSLNYAIRGTATGVSGSTDVRGISSSASGSTNNYGGFMTGTATSTNTAFGVYAEGYGGDVAYGVYAKASGASSTNYSVYALSPSPSCTTGACSNAAIYANGPGYTTGQWYTSSDVNIKKNIQAISDYWTVLNGLNGYRYDYETTLNSTTNLNLSSEPQMGLIAQEVEAVAPELVKSFINPGSTDSAGFVKNNFSVKSINYDGLIPVLVEAIKDLKAQVDSLTANASSIRIKNNINNIENNNKSEELAYEQKIILSNQLGIILNQNDPNPFSESTRIRYYIPEEVQDARLIFSSENGMVLKTVQLSERGDGSIEVYASDLSSGLYIYTLMANGKIIESKKMIKQ